MFIYDAIMDHIQCGVNEIEAMQIKAEIEHLSKKLGNGRTGFEEIFEVNKMAMHSLRLYIRLLPCIILHCCILFGLLVSKSHSL